MKWQPIEIAPNDGDQLLVWWPSGVVKIAQFIDGDYWFESNRGNHLCNKIGFSLWALLPKPEIPKQF